MKMFRACFAIAVVLLVLAAVTARAEFVRIDVTSRADLTNGKTFGTAGPYERIVGKAVFMVDPRNPHNRTIPGIDKAPRNAKGLVEFSADIHIIAPKDQSKGNGVAFFEVPNRGRRDQFTRFSRAPRGAAAKPENEFGDESLLQAGYTLIWLGWQFSVVRDGGLIGIELPVPLEDGQPVVGRVTAPFPVNAPTQTVALDPDTSRYTPVDINSPDARLTVRQNIYDTPRVIPRNQWQFAKIVEGKVVPDSTSIYMKDGFLAGQNYELSYQAKGPVVGGLGYAALRDAASAFKYRKDTLVSARYAYAFGESQTGRVVREFLYEGFNADEQGRKAFDLAWAHIAGAARGDFIQPFSLPNGLGTFTGSMFPFSDLSQRDPTKGRNDGLFAKMGKDVVPKVIYTNSDCEYWGGGRAAALTHTTIDGKRDLQLPENVRIYMLAGTQHVIPAFPPPPATATQQRANPNDYTWALRAILVSADKWVREGVEPVPSRYPKLSDGTLVPQDTLKFPAIPGVQKPSIIPGGYRADLGGPTSPKIPFLVPQVDADGNDIGGIRLPDQAVPLATYTGWNFRNPATGAPTEIVSLQGSFIPFPLTRADRERTGDPRLSIEERYGTKDAYLAKVRAAAQKLVQEQLLLAPDVEPLVTRDGQVWDHITMPASRSSQ